MLIASLTFNLILFGMCERVENDDGMFQLRTKMSLVHTMYGGVGKEKDHLLCSRYTRLYFWVVTV